MSGLTDNQFSTVCDLAERVATRRFDGQEAVDMDSLPRLLEDLLAAAKKAIAIDPVIFADHEMRWKTREEVEADAIRQWKEDMKMMEKTAENAEAEERVREMNDIALRGKDWADIAQAIKDEHGVDIEKETTGGES